MGSLNVSMKSQSFLINFAVKNSKLLMKPILNKDTHCQTSNYNYKLMSMCLIGASP